MLIGGSSNNDWKQRVVRSWQIVTDWSKPNTFEESRQIAREGGSVARDTRRNIESRIGQSVISTTNAHDKLALDVTIPAIEQEDVEEENDKENNEDNK